MRLHRLLGLDFHVMIAVVWCEEKVVEWKFLVHGVQVVYQKINQDADNGGVKVTIVFQAFCEELRVHFADFLSCSTNWKHILCFAIVKSPHT